MRCCLLSSRQRGSFGRDFSHPERRGGRRGSAFSDAGVYLRGNDKRESNDPFPAGAKPRFRKPETPSRKRQAGFATMRLNPPVANARPVIRSRCNLASSSRMRSRRLAAMDLAPGGGTLAANILLWRRVDRVAGAGGFLRRLPLFPVRLAHSVSSFSRLRVVQPAWAGRKSDFGLIWPSPFGTIGEKHGADFSGSPVPPAKPGNRRGLTDGIGSRKNPKKQRERC